MKHYIAYTTLILGLLNSSICPLEGTEQERQQGQILTQFATNLAVKHGMKLLLYGRTGDLVDSINSRCGFSFIDFRLATIDQARPIVISMLKALWDKFNGDPNFRYWLCRSRPNQFYAFAFAMKISYWDQNYDRPLAPSLSQVRVAEDKIEYYTASPKDQSLQLIHSESIAEALKIVSCPTTSPVGMGKDASSPNH